MLLWCRVQRLGRIQTFEVALAVTSCAVRGADFVDDNFCGCRVCMPWSKWSECIFDCMVQVRREETKEQLEKMPKVKVSSPCGVPCFFFSFSSRRCPESGSARNVAYRAFCSVQIIQKQITSPFFCSVPIIQEQTSSPFLCPVQIIQEQTPFPVDFG